MGTHYSDSQNILELRKTVSFLADTIQKDFGPKGRCSSYVPLFIYRGMSGVSYVTALVLELMNRDREFFHGMVYVRKEGEKSHGISVEYNAGYLPEGKKYLLVFVDDFIDEGNTLCECYRDVLIFKKENEFSYLPDFDIMVNEEVYLCLGIELCKWKVEMFTEMVDKMVKGLMEDGKID